MIDADGSTDPAEIPQFVAALVDGADFVKGSRFAQRRQQPRHHPAAQARQRRASTWWSTSCSGPASPTSATATTRSGARVVPVLRPAGHRACRGRPTARKLWGDGFEIETMINIRAAADGMKVGEVGSIEHARIHGESNLNTFRDGFRVLRTIFSEYGRMRRQRRAARRAGRPPIRRTSRPAAPQARHGRDRQPGRHAGAPHHTDPRQHLTTSTVAPPPEDVRQPPHRRRRRRCARPTALEDSTAARHRHRPRGAPRVESTPRPAVSIVIPTHSEQRWDSLVRTVASARSQNVPARRDRRRGRPQPGAVPPGAA